MNDQLEHVRKWLSLPDLSLDELVAAARTVCSDDGSAFIPISLSTTTGMSFSMFSDEGGHRLAVSNSALRGVIMARRAEGSVLDAAKLCAGSNLGGGDATLPPERLKFGDALETEAAYERRWRRWKPDRHIPTNDDLLDLFEPLEGRSVALVTSQASDTERFGAALSAETAHRKKRGAPPLRLYTSYLTVVGMRFDAIIDLRSPHEPGEIPHILSSLKPSGHLVRWGGGAWRSWSERVDVVPLGMGMVDDLTPEYRISGWSFDWAIMDDALEPTPTPDDEPARLAEFFATSEHDRHKRETEPDWRQLSDLLPDSKYLRVGSRGWEFSCIQLDGVVWCAVMTDAGNRTAPMKATDLRTNVPVFDCPAVWWIERVSDAQHAQRLIDAAIPNLPRVPRKS